MTTGPLTLVTTGTVSLLMVFYFFRGMLEANAPLPPVTNYDDLPDGIVFPAINYTDDIIDG